jgi:hypothetical protein
MKQLSGIKYTKDRIGNRYVRIDLNRYGNNPLLEDFLDGLEIEKRKGEPTVTFEEFVKEENKRRGIEDV